MMKNLFKNLMLVAVAAMAFTACQKDNGELDAPKRIVNFTANIGGDDTRSGFTSKEDNGYKSAWDGGETLFVKAENTEKWPTIDAEGKFSVEFSADDQFATFYSPVASWEYNTSYGIYMPVVPATQTPRANSVDPAAHILQAQNVLISGSENIKVTFEHVVAYGKMTVNTPAGFDISKVEINLVGAEYGVEKDLTYTINADNVENNVFWFATETLKVSEMTVTAYGKEGETDKIYSKTVTVAEGKLEFYYGHVGSFSVSNLTEQEAPEALLFTSAYESNRYSDQDRVLRFTDEHGGLLVLNLCNAFTSNSIDIGTYNTSYSNYGYIYTQDYTTYNNIGVYSGEVVVSVVNGKYFIEFKSLKDANGSTILEYAIFNGLIDGYYVPDNRTMLTAPTISVDAVNDLTATISWDAVEGAVEYLVTSSDDHNVTTTETSVDLEFSSYGAYYVYVKAIAATDDANYKDSDNSYTYVDVVDPRTKLSTPEISWTASGKTVTFTWNAVDNATVYYLYNYYDNSVYVETTETTATLTLADFSTSYTFCIVAKADPNSTEYRDSDIAYTYPMTEKDPDKFVDYQYATLSWNNTYSRFELTGNGYNVTQFYLNSSDAPNNNSIKPGTYTYAGNTVSNPAVGTFSLRHILGSGSGSSHFVNDASMSVTIEDGQYCIVITIISAGNGNIVGKTFGYKGLPDGFVLPSEGGDSGDDNTGDGGEEDGFIQMTKLYYDSTASNIHNFIMSDADGRNKITISLNKNDVLQTWIPAYDYASKSLTAVNGNTGYCSLQYDTAKINGTSYTLNATGHTLKVLSSSNGGNHEIELYVVTSGGDEYKFKFSGNLGL